MSGLSDLSVVIPVLDSEATLPRTLESLVAWRQSGKFGEVVIVDGGSKDEGIAISHQWGARVLRAPAGRGSQLAKGGREAQGSWLLFLHGDTRLDTGWEESVAQHIKRAEGAGIDARQCAAFFRLTLDDGDPRARRIEALARWRACKLGLPYGDQGLLMSRRHYDELGGYRDLPLMEDVDLARRIGSHGLVELNVRAITSARRYQESGWIMRPLLNLSILGLYFLGLPPLTLKRLYGS
ncbi:MAG: TIGR04283 family arsenosugar biosynthesis glycosyltransferase [Kiloniellales bacterium]|nr:TIGR04283 family arsenosugar biosynthesis glycosyltransferase [Kiloniellales bacterium]